MTFGCASQGSGGPLGNPTPPDAAWVAGPDGGFTVDLRTGARDETEQTDAVRYVLIPGLDVPFVADPSRHVFVPVDRPFRGPEDHVS